MPYGCLAQKERIHLQSSSIFNTFSKARKERTHILETKNKVVGRQLCLKTTR